MRCARSEESRIAAADRVSRPQKKDVSRPRRSRAGPPTSTSCSMLSFIYIISLLRCPKHPASRLKNAFAEAKAARLAAFCSALSQTGISRLTLTDEAGGLCQIRSSMQFCDISSQGYSLAFGSASLHHGCKDCRRVPWPKDSKSFISSGRRRELPPRSQCWPQGSALLRS